MQVFGQRRTRLVAIGVAAVLVVAGVSVGLALRGGGGGGSDASPHGQTVVADASTYVNTSRPDRSYGSGTTIRLSAKPRTTGYVRFPVQGLTGQVAHAWLRLWVQSAPAGSLTVAPMPEVTWAEQTLTYDNSPPLSAAPLATATLRGGRWTSIDVTNAVQGNGEVAFALDAASGGRMSVDSRHGTHPPQLVVQAKSSAGASQTAFDQTGLLSDLQDTVHSTAAHAALRDDKGNSMDSLKVTQDSYGDYLGIYHTTVNGVLTTMLATSTDLVTWHWRTVIDSHASQPTIQLMPDTSYLVAEEADSNGLTTPARTWLRFRLYPTLTALLSNQPSRTFDAPHTLVSTVGGAEGTPSIDWVAMHPDLAHSVIQVGFHYFMNATVDREAIGMLVNFTSWSTHPNDALNNALTQAGLQGGFGERDSFVYGNRMYQVVEAQAVPNGLWHSYLYSSATNQVQALHIQTPGGSSEFANPRVTLLRGPMGGQTMVATTFLPRRGAKGGEAGELLYYTPIAHAPRSVDPTIVTAGDIACDPTLPVVSNACQQAQTAALVEQIAPDALLPLGDDQYDEGRFGTFLNAYDVTWGLLRAISHPVPGNHEYESKGAAGYYQYYGVAAGPAGAGYYSYNIGSWHMVALNANCTFVGGCGAGSPEERWLAADLATNTQRCILAYWHQPRFSSGEHGNEPVYDAFWRDLYAAHTAIILNGHDHDYERFAPQTPDETANAQGIREFVVGTGGKSLRGFNAIQPTSQVHNSTTFGVLQLTLHSTGYDWKFVPIAGQSFTDSGSGTCP